MAPRPSLSKSWKLDVSSSCWSAVSSGRLLRPPFRVLVVLVVWRPVVVSMVLEWWNCLGRCVSVDEGLAAGRKQGRLAVLFVLLPSCGGHACVSVGERGARGGLGRREKKNAAEWAIQQR